MKNVGIIYVLDDFVCFWLKNARLITVFILYGAAPFPRKKPKTVPVIWSASCIWMFGFYGVYVLEKSMVAQKGCRTLVFDSFWQASWEK